MISSSAPVPTSLMKKRVPAALGSNAKRNGFRWPQEKVSLHWAKVVRPLLAGRRQSPPVVAQGLEAGMPPSRVMRRTLPVSTFWFRAAKLSFWQPPGGLKSQPPSPIVM